MSAPVSRVLLLAGSGASTAIVAAALAERHPGLTLVREAPIPAHVQLRQRIRRYGLRVALGQALFRLASPLLAWRQRDRAAALRRELAPVRAPELHVVEVDSANSPAAHAAIRAAAPAVVVVCGTRILSKSTLRTAPTFVNLHAGLTPAYRGVHGGYWALVEGDRGNVGVTVHLVDPGVDTGAILGQTVVETTPADGFFTLPLLQLRAGLPLLVAAVDRLLDSAPAPMPAPPGSRSRQWSHPTLWQYLSNGIRRHVW